MGRGGGGLEMTMKDAITGCIIVTSQLFPESTKTKKTGFRPVIFQLQIRHVTPKANYLARYGFMCHRLLTSSLLFLTITGEVTLCLLELTTLLLLAVLAPHCRTPPDKSLRIFSMLSC
jgi:hypothetical protein